jgi:hypothetical protein
MTLARRLDALKDGGLTPQQAVILWMREAHGFGSLEAYTRWLLCQPDDLYPLIRMPRQVVGAARASSKKAPDPAQRDQLYRAQKDVIFLYFLHKQIAMRALADREAIQLRVVILVKEFRALTIEKHALDQMRLQRIDLEGKRHGRPGKLEKTAKALYLGHVEEWLPQARDLRARILAFHDAAGALSRRYFGGEDLLYPDTRENLTWNLGTIATLTESYADSFLAGSPQSDDDFRDYVLALLGDEKRPEEAAPSLTETDAPDVTRAARRLAEEWVLLAKSETLEKLGEQREAEAIAERLLREGLGG